MVTAMLGYTPNFAFALMATLVYAILTIFHSWLIFRPQLLGYLIPIPIAAFMEAIGYGARAFLSRHSPEINFHGMFSFIQIIRANM